MRSDRRRAAVRAAVARERGRAEELASRIWELAEPPMQECGSAALLADYLAGRGFRVEFPFRQMPTAFRAVRGRGRPVVGMLGEYDALPDCGARKSDYGHACGHNLLGTAAAVGAVAAAELLAARGRAGRVVYWGCPGEEALAGKVYMARDGGFRGMDACLAWHPGGKTTVNAAGGAALDSVVLEFTGRTAHGASAHMGRSALDAALLTDVSVNYLREHVPDNVRIHSVIPDGGKAPNVVPESAAIWYYVRAKDRDEVDEITRRLLLCAKGAATATETRLKVRKLTAVYSRLRNRAIAELLRDNLLLMGAPRATKADRDRVSALGLEPDFEARVQTDLDGAAGRATSDEDSVSWLAPLGCFTVACVAKPTRGHHRDYTAQSNLPFAHRGMVRAAEVLAASALDLATRPKLLAKVRAEFARGTRGFSFAPLVPKRQRPPVGGTAVAGKS